MSSEENNPYKNVSNTVRNLIIVTVMLAAALELLDSTIVNVALNDMMASLSASQDQITWVLTSYTVAAAIMIPLTGYLSTRLGEKNLLVSNIAGFMVFSFLCGVTTSLSGMVTFRVFQGMFGASLMPLSQSILKQSFPLEKQGKAMGIWSLGIVLAPVFGPTLGGYIIESSSWRWIFYVNMPICIVALILAITFIPNMAGRARKADWTGVFLMVVGIGALQVMLDQGQTEDWFDSPFIFVLAVASFFGMLGFIYRSSTYKHPIARLSVFKNRNFSCCTIALAIYMGCFMTTMVIQALMLQNLYGYTPKLAGITTIPVGLCSMVSIIICSNILNKINVKYCMIIAVFITSYGCYRLSHFTIEAAQINFMMTDAFLGIGCGFFFIPTTVYALATMDKKYVTEASGLFSYGRMLGQSIGISVFSSTILYRLSQINTSSIGSYINPFSHNLHLWLQKQGLSIQNPVALSQLQQTVAQQATLRSFLDVFFLSSLCFLVLIPIILYMNNVKLTDTTPVAH